MKKERLDVVEKVDRRKIVECLIKDGQVLLPFIDLICNAEQAIDELIDVTGRAVIEAVLELSALEVAGPKQPSCIRPPC